MIRRTLHYIRYAVVACGLLASLVLSVNWSGPESVNWSSVNWSGPESVNWSSVNWSGPESVNWS